MQIGKEFNNMRYMFEIKYIVFSIFIMMYITVLFFLYQSITSPIVKEENIVQLGREQKYYEIYNEKDRKIQYLTFNDGLEKHKFNLL